MAQGNGQGYKEHLLKLNILLEEKAPADDLMPALTHCFIDVLSKLEEREGEQKEINEVLFGKKTIVDGEVIKDSKGVIAELRPIIKDYKVLKAMIAFVWVPGAAIAIALWEYAKRKIFGA